MLNYIKSECYRIFHTKEIYLMTGILSALTVAMNLVLYVFTTNNFPYANVMFSMNLLTGYLNILLAMGCMVAGFTFGDEHKNGTLKNVVAYGISRNTFFTGKCIVCSIMALLSMAVVMFFYIGSAFLLLENSGMTPLWEMLKGVGAALPSAFASLILTVLLYSLIKKEGLIIIIWAIIIWMVPNISFYLGLKIDLLNKMAEWMPYNFLRFEVSVNMSGYNCLWNTPEGLAKCLIAGTAGIIIFYVAGIFLFRKKDIV